MGQERASGAPLVALISQRTTYTFEHADQKMTGKGELSYDDVNWDDDLEIA